MRTTAIVETAEGKAEERGVRLVPLAAGILAAGLCFVGGLAAGRILYEWLFPDQLWLGRPLPGLLVAGAIALLGWLYWRLLAFNLIERVPERIRDANKAAALTALIPFLPLILNLAFLSDAAVNLQRSRSLFLASLWLAAVFLSGLLARSTTWRWLAYVLIVGFLLPVYLATMGRTVGTADTFEFQVVTPRLGIVHPTGYPLYLLLAKPFTWLPLNEVAWRVNLATLLFGLAAVCTLYTLGLRLTGWRVPALLAAVAFGLTPTFWSQSINAEVYSLHALIVAAALLLMREIGDWKTVSDGQWVVRRNQPPTAGPRSLTADHRPLGLDPLYATVLLALVLGLGLTNHLTTVILLPAAGLAVFMAWRAGRYRMTPLSGMWSAIVIVGAFCLPLLLYAYLPIRWAAVNDEAMSLERFADWVIGGRFQGALQLSAWLRDSTRYAIVGRLILHEWPAAWGTAVIVIGLMFLFARQWRYALLLAITWLGYSFYALSYYVPDLAVFLIPAFLTMALFWIAGLVALLTLIARVVPVASAHFVALLQALVVLIAIFPPFLLAAGQTWPAVDSSQDDGRSTWGRNVLELPIPFGSAILADSDKFPPLYYWQQVEGRRPDLDIVVLPDESAYRAELEARIAAGQPVYLARFLPGLESIYHLRSFGPLIEVGLAPDMESPATEELPGVSFGAIQLVAYQLALVSPFAEGESAITLFWRASEPPSDPLHVYMRWASETFAGQATSQHPAGNSYPTVAWQVGEVVPDFHVLPQPLLTGSERVDLQVAMAPPFTPAEELEWQTVTTVDWQATEPSAQADPLRIRLGPLNLDGAVAVEPARSATPLVVKLTGYGEATESLLMAIIPSGGDPGNADWQLANPAIIPGASDQTNDGQRLSWTGLLDSELPAGSYDILAAHSQQPASCGWLAQRTDSCVVAQVEASSAAPPDAVANFEDKIALIAIDVPDKLLRPGGELPLTLTWQALAPMSEDYTVFVQVLDADDRIVGQVDAWPVQGTYPTGQWPAGETIEDPYQVRLSDDLPPGQYKLYIGWYLLETLRRLPIIDQDGQIVDDKVIVPGLAVNQ